MDDYNVGSTCSECGGTGKIDAPWADSNGYWPSWPCPKCQATNDISSYIDTPSSIDECTEQPITKLSTSILVAPTIVKESKKKFLLAWISVPVFSVLGYFIPILCYFGLAWLDRHSSTPSSTTQILWYSLGRDFFSGFLPGEFGRAVAPKNRARIGYAVSWTTIFLSISLLLKDIFIFKTPLEHPGDLVIIVGAIAQLYRTFMDPDNGY